MQVIFYVCTHRGLLSFSAPKSKAWQVGGIQKKWVWVSTPYQAQERGLREGRLADIPQRILCEQVCLDTLRISSHP